MDKFKNKLASNFLNKQIEFQDITSAQKAYDEV